MKSFLVNYTFGNGNIGTLTVSCKRMDDDTVKKTYANIIKVHNGNADFFINSITKIDEWEDEEYE